MSVEPLSPREPVELSVALGDKVIDLATRALVVAVVPTPTWGREAEVLAGVRVAADSGSDLVEVPAEPRLLGPVVSAARLPVAAQVKSAAAAASAREAGADLLLVRAEHLSDVVERHFGAPGDDRAPHHAGCPVAVLVSHARDVRGVSANQIPRRLPVAVDTVGLSGADLVAETALALTVGARLVRSTDIRRARRIVEVMAALLAARRGTPQ